MGRKCLIKKGIFDTPSACGGVVHFVQADALAELFRLFSSHVQCVLLNACYSEIQANAIVENINFVIGMDRSISDRAAIQFAIGFYDALGAGKSVETAYSFGCNSIHLIGIEESLTPKLKRKNNILQENNINSCGNQNPVVNTNTCFPDPQAPIKTTYEFVMSGSIDETEKSKLEAIVAHLKTLTRDTSLTLLKVESGSIKLVLEGSEEGFKRLESLVISGALDQIQKISVLEINRRNPKNILSSSASNEFTKRGINSKEKPPTQPSYKIPYQKYEPILLSYGNYPGIDLQGHNLQDSHLQGCNLRGANLKGANLSGADLRRVNLNSANLCHADLVGADLTGANLINANLSGANLYRVDLQRANLERADLSHACLIEAQLLGTCLRRAKLKNAQLTRAKLDGANLRGTNLSYADLQEVSLNQANLTFATLHKAKLKGARLMGSYMRGVDLSNAQLTDADLSGALLVGANLRGADLQNARLFRANLSDAVLEGSNLDDTKLSRAYLSSANLKNVTLNRAEMTEVVLLRACLHGAELCHALLNRAYLNEADLSEVNLSDANFSSANLTRVKLQGAQVIATRFEGSLGVDEGLRDALSQRGAIVTLIPRYPDPLMLGQTDLEILCQINEAKDNIVRRFDDLKEALQAFQKIVGFVKVAVQDHPRLALTDPCQFDQEHEYFRELISVEQENIFARLESAQNRELQEWLIDQYPQELDAVHNNIQQLSLLTYAFHELWISLLDWTDDEGNDSDLSEE